MAWMNHSCTLALTLSSFLSSLFSCPQLILGEEKNPGFIKTLAAGALTGMTASTICYPLDLVRSVLSVQTTTAHYDGIAHAMKSIVAKDGFFGLYRGIAPTLMGIAPYVAINMAVFDQLKRRYQPARDNEYFTFINLGLGASAGFCAAAITYPTDLIRRRMQLQGMKGSHDLPEYRNTWHCITETVRIEGVRGMYKVSTLEMWAARHCSRCSTAACVLTRASVLCLSLPSPSLSRVWFRAS